MLEPGEGALLRALAAALKRTTGVDVPLDAFDLADLPAHFAMNFRVVDDEDGRELAMGRDIAALRAQLGVKARRQFSERARHSFERKGVTAWDFGELPEQVEFSRGGQSLIGYPALVDEGNSVALVVLDTEHDAEVATRMGLRRLFQLAVPEQVKHLARSLPGLQEMALRYALLLELEGGKPDKGAVSDRLRQELVDAACDRAFFVDAEPVRDANAFQARVTKARTRLTEVAAEVCRVMNEVLAEYQALRPRINQPGVPVWQRAMTDIRNQLKELLKPGFVVTTPWPRLKQFPRYLQAASLRVDKLSINPAKDAQWMQQIQGWWQSWQGRVQADRARGVPDARLDEFRWMLEELRVSLWAQQLKTPYPISFKRLEKAWAELG